MYNLAEKAVYLHSNTSPKVVAIGGSSAYEKTASRLTAIFMPCCLVSYFGCKYTNFGANVVQKWYKFNIN